MSGFGKKGDGLPTSTQPPGKAAVPTMPGLGGAPRQKAPSAGAQVGAVIPVSEREFEAEVLRSEVPVLIEFASARSVASKQVAPEVAEFAREMAGKVKVVVVDADRSPTIVSQLRVQSIPTFMVFAKQRIADMLTGALRKKQLLQMVEPFLPRAAGALKAAELSQLLTAGVAQAVDTREEGAFKRAHLPGAVHVPLDDVRARLEDLQSEPGQIVLYCRAGDKTKELASALDAEGQVVSFLDGGLLGWEAEGLPIQR